MKKSKIIGSVLDQQTQIIKKKETIVIADDDPAILEAMKLMLELFNFNVETVSDGMVVSKLMSVQPRLLFLDIWMSGVDGREVCKTIKNLDATKNIPVVMISASCNLKDSIKETGADDFLAKPFEMNELLSKINKYILN